MVVENDKHATAKQGQYGSTTTLHARFDAEIEHDKNRDISHGGSGGSGKLPSSFDPSGTTSSPSSASIERPPASAATSSASSKMQIKLNIAGVSTLLVSTSAILQAT